ncbi:ABC transporter permease [Undibacterium sp.]|uniref:ABC transporter permease n=1 Tax=Undibacterium sp. TaxID=1914977 RepID=UPI00374FFC80
MIFTLIRIELLKVKRSLALLMMLACPLMVALLCFGLELKTNKTGVVKGSMYWMGNTAIWAYFMFPLYIALVTGLLNGNEHKNGTWRLMLTLPISARQLFFSKFVLAGLFMIGANVILFLMASIAMMVFSGMGLTVKGSLTSNFMEFLIYASIGALPILVFQHWISWRVQNIVAPLAIGVVGTMGIMQLGQSKDWVFYPWSYVMNALNASLPELRMQALMLAVVVAALMLFFATYWVGRRGAEFQ